VLDVRVAVGVGACLVEDDGVGRLEVGVANGGSAVDEIVSERVQHGVTVAQDEPSARAQQRRDDPGPASMSGSQLSAPAPV
jgi:hypothetical protein